MACSMLIWLRSLKPGLKISHGFYTHQKKSNCACNEDEGKARDNGRKPHRYQFTSSIPFNYFLPVKMEDARRRREHTVTAGTWSPSETGFITRLKMEMT